MTYCEYINTLSGENYLLHKDYHDNHYGFPVNDDDRLFERLMFEINQAGLNWILILKKQHNFRKAFDNYNIKKVASYGEEDMKRLMADPGIIRNRLKIKAAINNAKVILRLQDENGSFVEWIEANSKKTKNIDGWTLIFRKNFSFTGREIVKEFLMSIGYLPGAHGEECPVSKKIKEFKDNH
jgi:DNA-3-methyladenine glycosylase I